MLVEGKYLHAPKANFLTFHWDEQRALDTDFYITGVYESEFYEKVLARAYILDYNRNTNELWVSGSCLLTPDSFKEDTVHVFNTGDELIYAVYSRP